MKSDLLDQGKLLLALGRSEEALECFQRALDHAHDLVEAHINMGAVCEQLERDDEAADSYHLALAFDPGAVQAELGLARLLRKQGKTEASVACLRHAVELAPGCAEARFELARSLGRAGDIPGAIAAYGQALELDPEYAAACVNLGLIHLSQLGDASAAEALFRRAVAIDPALGAAQANLGLALQEQGRFEEALALYREQIDARPELAELRWNRGIANLALGRFAAGWGDYELRKGRPDAGGVHGHFPLPDWDGSPLAGRAVLVYGEQGVGDEIMFASCLPDVLARAGSCVVECDARVAPLYRRSFPTARIEARGRERRRDWRAAHPALAVQSAVGSLPRFLRQDLADFPAHRGYLTADAGATARWRERLLARGPGPWLGISWRGGTSRTRSELRSLTLAQIAPVLDRAGAHCLALQRDVGAEERAELARRGVLVPDPVADIDDLAALIAALDLVISVPGTNVHLAGALGKPLWIPLSYSPEWRYLWSGERMPWYPSARLLRQPRPGDWASVVADLCQRLAGGQVGGYSTP